MADTKLSALTAATTIAANDLLYGVISSNSRRITRDNFCANMGPIVSSGTATATKLVPTGNVTAGNGMYLPATNAVAFSTNGSERVRINASGDVGIGTDSPDTRLTVLKNSNADFTSRDTLRASALMTFRNNSATSAIVFPGFSTNRDKFIAVDNFGAVQNITLGFLDSDGVRRDAFSTDANGITIFRGITVEAARILANGNVGIGLTAPNVPLEVAGNIHVSGGDRTIFNRSNNSLQLGTNNSARLTITAGGAFGFATATPNASAVVDIVSTTQGFLPPRMTGTQRDAIGTPAAGLIVYNTTSNKLNFYNGSAWRAVDDSAV